MQLEQERFEAFLFGLDPDREFIYLSCGSCLIATFIQNTTSHSRAACGGDGWQNLPIGSEGYHYARFPHWLNTFSTALARYVAFSVRQAQQIYISLFGDPRINLPSAPEPVVKPELVSAS